VGNKEELIDPKILNDEGGIDPRDEEEMERAKKADLITLPGGLKSEVVNKRFCNNKSVEMFVTARMCCAYWDNKDVRRPWTKIEEPEYIDQLIG
jgi:hypothetical protein